MIPHLDIPGDDPERRITVTMPTSDWQLLLLALDVYRQGVNGKSYTPPVPSVRRSLDRQLGHLIEKLKPAKKAISEIEARIMGLKREAKAVAK